MLEKTNSVLLVPPAPPGSFGDEAIIIGSINYLLEQGISRIGVVSHLKPERERHPVLPIEFVDCSDFFQKKDDTALSGFESALKEFGACLFFGADMLDGYYSLQTSMRRLRLVKLAHDRKVPTAIVGFSFNKSPKQEVVDAFKELGKGVMYRLRDRVSKARFGEATGLSSMLTADPAFLLSPYKHGPLYRDVRQFCRQNHRRERKVVGINPNYMPSLKSEDVMWEEFIDFHVRLISRIIEEWKCSVVLFPHDIRGATSDLALCRQIFDTMPADVRKRVFTAVPEKGASEIKGIAGLFDFCVCQRMHAAIACLGQGVPCLCVTYQDKFEGLLDHFGIQHLEVSRSEAFQDDVLFDKFKDALNEREQLHLQIRERLPLAVSLAEENFISIIESSMADQ